MTQNESGVKSITPFGKGKSDGEPQALTWKAAQEELFQII